MLSDIEIAQRATLKPIVELARDRLQIPESELEPYGRYKAKLSLGHIASLADRPDGKLILVSALSPTPRTRQIDDGGLGNALYGHYPVCIAKTQYSFSTDPQLRGAPSGHALNIREVRLAAGAEFVVLICGAILTMPGLPAHPSSAAIDVDDDGRIIGCSETTLEPLRLLCAESQPHPRAARRDRFFPS